ncbi:efflux RND transporter periplasmic adaptor subunit [Christiangramia sabulilitoris]|uniref:Efflux RND transporter periplasmic adaptor subunit n=1 Tax=Christiangramia sabulilitoris TaxID=2583991 RepID=A0A550I8A9_9FLAO|nr:efflux RND transporter periplasmic adaptor subunit [Christiangramia sabulilitoris]TRO67058.1 efflux RND transporter periplasmic adaptor subunit [Christiangramia sabulilitoris]
MKTNKKNILTGLAILMGGILLGWLFFGGNNKETKEEEHTHSVQNQDEVWTCSMHPQIRQPEPGDCPICGMDLIPLSVEENSLDPEMFKLSENAMKLANISTMTVGTGEASKELRLNGKVEVDERNSYTQATHIPGRIEKLNVNFTGEKVNRGQTLAVIYSPAIVTAQEELLQAQEIKESQPELFAAAKQKLRNWKISDAQIDRMLSRGEPIDRFHISADVSGVVTELMAEQGDYLERGMPVYKIANLDKLWILFDLYETDLNWVREGSMVEYTVQSIPGQTFEGKIDFIDPLLNNNTRVATARIEVSNKELKLKPGMFVSGLVKNNISGAETQEMVIPKSAVLWTGERSVVYIKENAETGAGFKLREITLGPALGDSYVVQDGLQKGEEIVVNGTFTVDAAAQLQGKASMMNPREVKPGEDPEMKMEIPGNFQKQFVPVLAEYFELKDALVASDKEKAKAAAYKTLAVLKEMNLAGFSSMISTHLKTIQKMLQAISENDTLENQRDHFIVLSENMIALASNMEFEEIVYVQFCPMANNNQGANWLSLEEEIQNPYFGEAMLTCGEVKKKIK